MGAAILDRKSWGPPSWIGSDVIGAKVTPILLTVVRMEWPARSPDLNKIEHAWDSLQSAILARPVQPRTLQELKDALVAEWRLVPQNRIQTLITSMRMRCQNCN